MRNGTDHGAHAEKSPRGEFVDTENVNTVSRCLAFLSHRERHRDFPFLPGRFPSSRRDFNCRSLNDRSPLTPVERRRDIETRRAARDAVTYRQVAAENCIVTPAFPLSRPTPRHPQPRFPHLLGTLYRGGFSRACNR